MIFSSSAFPSQQNPARMTLLILHVPGDTSLSKGLKGGKQGHDVTSGEGISKAENVGSGN